MQNQGIEKKRFASAWALFGISLAVILVFCGAFFAKNVAFADDQSLKNLSFARLTSAASAYFDVATNSAVEDRPWMPTDYPLTAGEAGVMVGYLDNDWDDLPLFGWIISDLTSGAQGRGYTGATGGTASIHYAIEQYLAYGFALNDLGLDSTANQTFDIASLGRGASGLLTMAFYFLSMSVDLVFAFVFWLLRLLNPFSWFMGPSSAVNRHGMGEYLADAVADSGVGGPFGVLQGMVTDLYNGMDNMAWSILVPLFFLIMVASLVLFSSARKNAASKVRKWLTYTAFVVLGIPLLGSTYTMALDATCELFGVTIEKGQTVLDIKPTGMMDSSYIVASTFCDFEGWASKTNLAWPAYADVTVEVQENNTPILANNHTPTRTLCRKVNEAAGIAVTNTSIAEDTNASDKWNVAAMNVNGNDISSGATDNVWSLLQRYTNASFYTASDYETAVKANIGDNASVAEGQKKFNDYKNWTGNANEPWGGGGLAELIGPNSYTATGTSIANSLTGSGDLASAGKSVTFNSPGSLSTLSMYNYLRTTFEPSSVNVFQPEKAVNLGSNPAHRSVNLIGTGLMCPLYWFNCIVMLIVMTLIGLGYAFPILFSNLRRAIQMVISVPFAMIGMLRSAARVVSLVFMMILEILVTAFAYQLVKLLLVSLNNMLESLLTGNTFAQAAAILSGLLSPVFLAIGIIFNIWFCIMALRMRKSLVKTVNEAMTSLVNRMFAVDGGGMPGAAKAGLLAAGAGAVGRGALMAASQAGSNMINEKVGQTELGQRFGLGKSSDATAANEKDDKALPEGGVIEGADNQLIPGIDAPSGSGGNARNLPVSADERKGLSGGEDDGAKSSNRLGPAPDAPDAGGTKQFAPPDSVSQVNAFDPKKDAESAKKWASMRKNPSDEHIDRVQQRRAEMGDQNLLDSIRKNHGPNTASQAKAFFNGVDNGSIRFKNGAMAPSVDSYRRGLGSDLHRGVSTADTSKKSSGMTPTPTSTGATGTIPVVGKGETKQSASEARTQAKMDEITGKTDVATAEANHDKAKQIASEQRKEAVKGIATGAAKTAKGVAEGVAAYSTGNAEMGKQAVRDGVEGTAQMVGSTKQAASASTDAKTAVAVEQNQRTAGADAQKAANEQQSASSAQSVDEVKGVAQEQTSATASAGVQTFDAQMTSARTASSAQAGPSDHGSVSQMKNVGVSPVNGMPVQQTREAAAMSNAQLQTSVSEGGSSAESSQSAKTSSVQNISTSSNVSVAASPAKDAQAPVEQKAVSGSGISKTDARSSVMQKQNVSQNTAQIAAVQQLQNTQQNMQVKTNKAVGNAVNDAKGHTMSTQPMRKTVVSSSQNPQKTAPIPKSGTNAAKVANAPQRGNAVAQSAPKQSTPVPKPQPTQQQTAQQVRTVQPQVQKNASDVNVVQERKLVDKAKDESGDWI